MGSWMGLMGHGAAAGALGFAAIALFFLLADVVAGRPAFYTAALLGGAMFYGVGAPDDVVVALEPVLAYSAVHLLAFLVLGVVASALASLASRYRHAWYLGVNLFLLVIAHASGVVMTLTEQMQGVVSAWMVAWATVAASVVMAAYLLGVSPSLRHELAEPQSPPA